ncbi:DUF4079 domain-containing protein [Oscillatoria sp. FACHB-1406]|uniref:DUF4079 domain-containing protein n=1 Tax=Oscillatoria sp. FACHB-1406 TaxID=2692846 RepID=UPI001686241E|nr:DUF4079 domain-containing protein [Oscillatoria sp. FACHB-1406]MBD2579695.1 DUF4079 domain-containing protein [Oscillatoria sp. FACHB-1406]
MNAEQWAGIIHPAIAILFVYPLLGIVVNFAWQTRQRRLKTVAGEKSKIPATVGREHFSMGRWLAGAVVGVWLIAIAYIFLFKAFLNPEVNLFAKNPTAAIWIISMFVATVSCFILLYRAQMGRWRAIFAVLTSLGLIIFGYLDRLGITEKAIVFRRDNEWFISHFYYGTLAAILAIASLAMVPEIHRDRSNRWRTLHIILNCLSLLLFLGQGWTGVRDLFEIGLYAPPPP